MNEDQIKRFNLLHELARATELSHDELWELLILDNIRQDDLQKQEVRV